MNKQENEQLTDEQPEQSEQTEPIEERAKKKRFADRVLGDGAAQAEQLDRKKLLKQFRRAKNIPSADDVERFSPSPDKGLSADQVELRFSQFLFNDVNKKYSKSYASIFVGNICTFFNFLCLVVALALAYAGAPLSQFLFVAIFGANLLIGIVQEILAKKQIDKLSVLISATAKVMRDGVKTEIGVRDIVLDDVILLEAGQQIPADCILLDGNVEINESLLTGESVPVKKAPGETLYAGSFVASGACRVRADKVGKATYLNSLTSKAKRYKKPKSEIMNSIRLFIRVIGILIPVIAALMAYINWRATGGDISLTIQFTGAVVIGMIPSGLLLLTSFAMAIGVMRLAKKQTLVQDLYSLEMLARVNVLCLDKTGTITDGRMTVNDVMILNNFVDHSIEEIMGSMLSALDDNNQTSIALYNRFGHSGVMQATATVPFSSKRKLSAVSFGDAGTFAMGAPEFVLRPMPPKIDKIVKQYAASGLRVLLLAYSPSPISGGRLPSLFRPAAIITLADNIRSDAIETIKWFRENDVDIKIISGDNPVTVSEVARRVGVKNASQYISLDGLTDLEVENVANQYTVFGRVTPEQKAILVRTIKKQGNTVAMTGDGVNDILAMREADCSVAIASGSEAARNVSHLVLLDSNFSSMPEVVKEGRRVVNNIQKSSALFLMKTLMSVFLSIISVIMAFAKVSDKLYFFDTSNLTALEIFVIAIPSFALALQPNTNIIKGNFLANVLRRCIPGGITLTIAVMSMYFYNRIGAPYGIVLTEQVYTTMLVNVVVFTGIMALVKICQPFNAYRAVLVVLTFALVTFGLTLFVDMFANLGATPFGDIISVLKIGFGNITFLTTIILLNYFILSLLTFLLSKIKLGESHDKQ